MDCTLGLAFEEWNTVRGRRWLCRAESWSAPAQPGGRCQSAACAPLVRWEGKGSFPLGLLNPIVTGYWWVRWASTKPGWRLFLQKAPQCSSTRSRSSKTRLLEQLSQTSVGQGTQTPRCDGMASGTRRGHEGKVAESIESVALWLTVGQRWFLSRDKWTWWRVTFTIRWTGWRVLCIIFAVLLRTSTIVNKMCSKNVYY